MQLLRAFVLFLATGLGALAEATKPPADASPAARAFLAFPQADRKAAQDALGWLGFYNGVVDGAWGKHTLDALKAYQQSLGAPPDAIIAARQLAALKQGAAKAKAAVGFRLIDDPVTGVRIGAPMKLLETRVAENGNVVLKSKDGLIQLYLRISRTDLASLYKSLSTTGARTKVTYKYMKPDAFLVTAGEQGAVKFYNRFATEGGKVRGFSFIYPKAQNKTLDPVALAIANSFEPFPAAPAPAPTPTPEAPRLAATALVVAPGVAVTALDPAQCKAPLIAGKPARFLAAQGGLARLGGEFGAGATAPPVGPGGGELIALSLDAAGLQAVPADPLGADKAIAALGPSGAGAPLFDRQGRLVAFVGPIAATPTRAGVPLRAPRPTIAAAGLGPPGPDGPTLTAAEIARLRRGAVVGVFCAP